MRLHSGNFTPKDQRLSSNQVVDDERPVEGGKRGGGEESLLRMLYTYNVHIKATVQLVCYSIHTY